MYQNILVTIIYLILLFKNVNLSSSYNILEHLGTKTAYRVIENKNDEAITYEGCEPLKIWIVVRHGTRLPTKKFIKEMNERLPLLKDEILKNSLKFELQMNDIDLEFIKTWKVSINESDEKILTHEGEDEMVNLAERMQSRFPVLLPNIYSNTTYKFKYTATQRTEESAKYFANGLFGRATARSVWYPEPSKRDPILRFYKLCNKWRNEIKKNPNSLKEKIMFINGTIFQNTLKTISNKLGFKRILSYDDLYAMYMTCAFESSWSKKALSPWCAPFSEETIKMMEYAEDLKYYWIDGYGYNITYKQACPALKNMVQFFKSNDVNPKAVLYFTHSGTILKLLAHLGLYMDPLPLKHDNLMQHSERQWRVSKIDAFGSNIAVILFRCAETEKILILHQERVVNLPGCSDADLCDFNTFLNAYNDSLNNCNFDEMCRI